MARLKTLVGSAVLALCACMLWATNTVEGGVRTIADEIVSVADESELNDGETIISTIILKDNGGVHFTKNITLTKTYEIQGSGIVSVADGVFVNDKQDTKNRKTLFRSAYGHTLIKRGKGVLQVGHPSDQPTASTPLNVIVEEGTIREFGGNFFGGHDSLSVDYANIDVREGAVFDCGWQYNTVGPIELTGGTFTGSNTNIFEKSQWINTAFMNSVTAHASSTPSRIYFPSWATLGNVVRTNTTFDVEKGAELIVDASLRNGFDSIMVNDKKQTPEIPGKLIKNGEGTLYLLRDAEWTGGTLLNAGTVVLGSSKALGEPVILMGDVTLAVLAGETVTIENMRLGNTYSATLTLRGDGQINLPESLSGITVRDLTTKKSPVALVGSTLTLSGGSMVVDVPAETELSITKVESVGSAAPYSEIVKMGAGTLYLPEGLQTTYQNLTVKDGFVVVSNESCFGSGIVTVTENGGLRFPVELKQARTPIICRGKATIDVPEGGRFAMKKQLFRCRGAAVTKTGAGKWKMDSDFKSDTKMNDKEDGDFRYLYMTTWTVDEGILETSGSDAFSRGYDQKPDVKICINEQGELRPDNYSRHAALGDVVLRGGSIFAGYAQFNGDAKTPKLDSFVEGGNQWKAFGLNGTITVEASTNGQPARISARTTSVGHNAKDTTTSYETIFDIKGDAVLEVDAFINPGRAAKNQYMATNVVTKKGSGLLKLNKGLGIIGTFQINEGSVEFGEGTAISDRATLSVGKNGKLILNDRARLALPVLPSSDGLRVDVPENAAATLILGETNRVDEVQFPVVKGGKGTLWVGGDLAKQVTLRADDGSIRFKDGPIPSRVEVWMDAADAATVVTEEDGSIVSVANKGSAGGFFTPNKSDACVGIPTWKSSGINGRSVVFFDQENYNGCSYSDSGIPDKMAQALALNTYTNQTSPRSVSIYAVVKRNVLHTYGGFFSLHSAESADADESSSGAMHIEDKSDNKSRYFFGKYRDGMASDDITGVPATGEPFIQVIHCYSNGWFVAWATNATAVGKMTRVAKNDVNFGAFNIDLVNLGSRLNRKNDTLPGLPKNGWTGEIGEFIVTTTLLSEDEEIDLLGYLRKKWLNKGDGSAEPPTWLVGNEGKPVTSTTTVLELADGAAVQVATEGPVQLGGLKTEGTTYWSRLWAGAPSIFQMFAVDGDVSLENVCLSAEPSPEPKTKILDWTGTRTGSGTWEVRTSRKLRVSRRSDSDWLEDYGFYLIIR